MTTSITIKTADHPVAYILTDQFLGQMSDTYVEVPPHSEATTHIHSLRYMTIRELPLPVSDPAPKEIDV